MMPTTPIGTRICAMRMPDGRLRDAVTVPIGSGSAAIWRSPSAIAAITFGDSVRRSIIAESSCCRRASARSRALASASLRASRSSTAAMAFSARFLVLVSARAITRAAARACRPTSCM